MGCTVTITLHVSGSTRWPWNQTFIALCGSVLCFSVHLWMCLCVCAASMHHRKSLVLPQGDMRAALPSSISQSVCYWCSCSAQGHTQSSQYRLFWFSQSNTVRAFRHVCQNLTNVVLIWSEAGADFCFSVSPASLSGSNLSWFSNTEYCWVVFVDKQSWRA